MFGLFLKLCREKEKMTQEELADRLGVTQKTVSVWEKGNNLPHTRTMIAIAEVFGLEEEKLFKYYFEENR